MLIVKSHRAWRLFTSVATYEMRCTPAANCVPDGFVLNNCFNLWWLRNVGSLQWTTRARSFGCSWTSMTPGQNETSGAIGAMATVATAPADFTVITVRHISCTFGAYGLRARNDTRCTPAAKRAWRFLAHCGCASTCLKIEGSWVKTVCVITNGNCLRFPIDICFWLFQFDVDERLTVGQDDGCVTGAFYVRPENCVLPSNLMQSRLNHLIVVVVFFDDDALWVDFALRNLFFGRIRFDRSGVLRCNRGCGNSRTIQSIQRPTRTILADTKTRPNWLEALWALDLTRFAD